MANPPIRPGFGIINHSVTRRTQHYPTLAEVYALLLDLGSQLDRIEARLNKHDQQDKHSHPRSVSPSEH